MEAVLKDEEGVFFVYGYGGTRKTFIWNTLSCALRSKGEIVLTVASSRIAELLILGGRVVHSRFTIPVVINEDSICNITQGSPFVSLFAKARLVIWDEAAMVHRHCFKALDRSLRDLLRFKNPNSMDMPFGGKVVVFLRDFRQILPVIPKSRRQDVVFASLNLSYLWDFCKVLKLTQNMRLRTGHEGIDVEDLKTFSEWILKVGDGNVGDDNDGEFDVQIPHDLLIEDSTNHIEAIVNSTYPGLLTNSKDCSYLQDRAILCPTLEIVHEVNDFIMAKWPGVAETYLSSDSICKADGNLDCAEDVYTPEFFNSITASGLTNHVLNLKVGIPVMLLRNIDQSFGLCNGTRLVITNLGKHVIEAKIIYGFNTGYKVFISRMVLTPSDLRLPFKLRRRQYPLIVCFAMTINKSQGQSLSHVGLYLPHPVFTHGQLYVAISRVKSRSGLKILICNEDGKTSDRTKNVVYKEVFGNLA